jgi:predicted nucleic acid-binding protein
MRVFLDANVLVAVLNKEYPLFPYAARVLSVGSSGNFTLVTSAVCLAIAFYFSEKKHGTQLARRKIGLLMQHLQIANCGEAEARAAYENTRAGDFEDALQYYAAVNYSCSCIVTQDLKGFFYADIEVLSPEMFLKKYLAK